MEIPMTKLLLSLLILILLVHHEQAGHVHNNFNLINRAIVPLKRAQSEKANNKDNHHFQHVAIAEPRFLNLTNFNLTRFLLSVSPTPEGFGNSLFNGIFITTFRTIGYYILGLIYYVALSSTEPGSSFRRLLDNFEFFFNANSFSSRLIEPFNLLFGLTLGRFVYLLVVFGPVATFRALWNTSGVAVIRREFTFNVALTNLFRFVFVEGMFTSLGFALTLLVGSFLLRDHDSRRRRRSSDSFNAISEEAINKNFEAIITNLERIIKQGVYIDK